MKKWIPLIVILLLALCVDYVIWVIAPRVSELLYRLTIVPTPLLVGGVIAYFYYKKENK